MPFRRRELLCVAATLPVLIRPALAHHGWSWAEEDQSRLEGRIDSVSMNPPHPSLRVRAADGTVWDIDLGNPNQTARSGFTAEAAPVGAAIIVIGNRNQDRDKAHMKAVQILIGGKQFDIYPDRIRRD
ncbi:DUF6152 family protein [Paracoccus ravus]|uniref:DUF6152 family protein n=1 Tax=Paracoccus ravus TaxID=2447760 RepID=UPI00106EE06C|nr:DUF6152 family protein [Paracoccus ravus]